MDRQLVKSAITGLSAEDQLLFSSYGVAPPETPPYELIQHAFEHHARCDPGRVAIEHEGTSITYGELDARAEELADLLRSYAQGPGDHVGLFLSRSISMVVGILATLKTGAAYVPQDLRIAPPAHLEHISRTAGIRVVLTTAAHADQVPMATGQVLVRVDGSTRTGYARASAGAPAPVITKPLHRTAVVIFTSGTTGRPNGVSVTHANLCNVLLNQPGALGIQPGMRVAQILNIAFDMAVWEIFGALSHGATLVIRNGDIEDAVRKSDVVIATPSVLGSLDVQRCRNVKIVAVAGERCPLPLADAWSEFAAFHNSCGPTEVTIVNTLERYEHGSGRLTIGRPLPNTTVYVLDADLRPCPIGEVGEMWAGGACVTDGYLGNPGLTGERYRPDPFLGGDHVMFRTRDLGRWTDTGELEHFGRTDDQVKVHGFRVELDAVTTALEQAPGCAQATTILHNGELVGFVTPRWVCPETAAATVGRELPYYYVPSRIEPVDELPRTDRGKIDKRALAARLELGAFELVGAVA